MASFLFFVFVVIPYSSLPPCVLILLESTRMVQHAGKDENGTPSGVAVRVGDVMKVRGNVHTYLQYRLGQLKLKIYSMLREDSMIYLLCISTRFLWITCLEYASRHLSYADDLAKDMLRILIWSSSRYT